MHFNQKQLFIFACMMLFCPGTATSETNLDFFFKDAAHYKDVIVDEIRSTDTILIRIDAGEKREVFKLIGLRAPKAPKSKKDDLGRDQYGFVKKGEVSPLTSVEEQAFDFVKEQHVGVWAIGFETPRQLVGEADGRHGAISLTQLDAIDSIPSFGLEGSC